MPKPIGYLLIYELKKVISGLHVTRLKMYVGFLEDFVDAVSHILIKVCVTIYLQNKFKI